MNCQHCAQNKTVENTKYCQHCINNMCIECKRVLPNYEKRHKIFTIIETNKFHCSPCYDTIWDHLLGEKICGFN
jgi:hypothetical protein